MRSSRLVGAPQARPPQPQSIGPPNGRRRPKSVLEAVTPRRAASLATAVILVATFGVTWLMYRAWRFDRETEVRAEADRIEAAVEHELHSYADALLLLQGVFEATAPKLRSPEWFARITRSWLARHRQFQGLGWLPRVETWQRPRFERTYPTIVGRGMRIRAIAGPGPLGPASPQGPWFPVAWIEPFRGNERALGVDIGSESLRRSALDDAVASDSVRMSRALALVQDPKGVWSHLVFVPIRAAGGGVEGLVDGVVKVPRIMDAAAREVSTSTDVEVVDVNGGPPQFLGIHRSATHRWELPETVRTTPIAIRRLTVVGHSYELRLHATPEFERRIPTNKAPYIAAIGLLLAAWVGSSLRGAEQRAREWRRRTDHDDLTGVLARGRLERAIELSASDSRRDRRSMALMMVDIDHFKAINDGFGHPVGDTVLRQVAQMLAGCLRDGDHVGRYGGEEFAIVLPRADADAARECAERIRRRVEEGTFGEPGGPIRVTVSIGLVAGIGPDPAALVRAADRGLYRAKHEGRNRVVVERV